MLSTAVTPLRRIGIRSIAVVLLLTAFAAALRFHRLGDWPFAVDEPQTLVEIQSLFGNQPGPPDSQLYRLPRTIPVSYALLFAGTSLFGTDEWGSRVVPAIMGSITVGAVFLLLEPAVGFVTALAAALLVALWPIHIFQSQETRFYTIAAGFVSVAMLLGGLAVARRSAGWAAASCAALILAMLSHTLAVVMLPVVAVATLGGIYAEDRRLDRRVLLVFVAAAVVVTAIYLVYLRPLLRGWNENATWSYSIPHAVLASINMLGWPLSLLAGVGLIIMVVRRSGQNWFWALCMCGWLGATVALPLVTSYHAEYVFPMALAGIVPAAHLIGVVYARLRPLSLAGGVAWVAAACLLNVPGVASEYVDGSRSDMRSAAAYVQAHWQPGDRVATTRVASFQLYAPADEPAVDLPDGDDGTVLLNQSLSGPGRLWVIADSTRDGLPPAVQAWLFDHAVHRLEVRRKRLDYYEYAMDVYVFDPALPLASRPAIAQPAPASARP
jgi:uncharacterized membrane protein